ncbi:unnamed protein product [Leptosia nina]|uniref:Uncharacterized protein n=1 Tax=Leptosia nina TaxID=320188 RepID=A0AAV1K483_9NEOP
MHNKCKYTNLNRTLSNFPDEKFFHIKRDSTNTIKHSLQWTATVDSTQGYRNMATPMKNSKRFNTFKDENKKETVNENTRAINVRDLKDSRQNTIAMPNKITKVTVTQQRATLKQSSIANDSNVISRNKRSTLFKQSNNNIGFPFLKRQPTQSTTREISTSIKAGNREFLNVFRENSNYFGSDVQPRRFNLEIGGNLRKLLGWNGDRFTETSEQCKWCGG